MNDMPQIDCIINGIAIIRKYSDDTPWLQAEHDAIYFGDYEATRDRMTPEERDLMEAYGWIEEYDSWCHYT